jgi:hypothetical protein
MKRIFIATIMAVTITSGTIYAQTTSDYLILQDIGPYKLDKPEKKFPGIAPSGGPEIYNNSPGIVGPADHFSLDHTDTTYKTMYIGGNGTSSPTVFVTKHAGSDSDKWLLHEIEDGYRDSDNLNATVDTNVQIRTISGKNVYFIGIYGGKSYTWISSGNVVVEVSCASCPNTRPEPLEVVQAYLAKHSSTITLTDSDLKSQAHSIQWIKDEMDRRLWLCDKWFMQLQLRKVDEKQVYQESVKSMNIFLDYREKYYGIKAIDEKNLIAGYLNTNNGTGIKAKLKEYKDWWVVNKDKAISL